MIKKTLTLSIKQIYFDEIASGKKKKEFRDIHARNGKKYIRYVCQGVRYENANDIPAGCDDEIGLEPVQYDYIKFLTGAYSGKRPWMIVEVEDIEIELFADEKTGEFITYEYEGETYIYAQIIYTLGKIVERSAY